jgi:hypothetical protein
MIVLNFSHPLTYDCQKVLREAERLLEAARALSL